MRRSCLQAVYALAKRDDRVVFVGSDLGPGTLAEFRDEFPDRYFMEGVAEANVIGMAAGLAMEGYIPFVNTIAPFITRRALEQVAIDLCLHELPVRLIANGGGVVYAPLGPTHLAIEDIAVMRALPNMTVFAASDHEEIQRFMDQSLDWPGPIYIRLAKGGDPVVSSPDEEFVIGKAILKRGPGEVLMVSTGITTRLALEAAEILADDGISCGVLHTHTVKPLDTHALCNMAAQARLVITIEEHSLVGGLGSAVAEVLMDSMEGTIPRLRRLGIPDVFPKSYGSQENMMATFGLTTHGIVATVRQAMQPA